MGDFISFFGHTVDELVYGCLVLDVCLIALFETKTIPWLKLNDLTFSCFIHERNARMVFISRLKNPRCCVLSRLCTHQSGHHEKNCGNEVFHGFEVGGGGCWVDGGHH